MIEFDDEYNMQCDCAQCQKCREDAAAIDADDDKTTTARIREDVASETDSVISTVQVDRPRRLEAHEGNYLLSSRQFASLRCLERHGFRYKPAADSFVYLDPRLTWFDIETLALLSQAEYVFDMSRRVRQKKAERCPFGSPPPMAFFEEVDDSDVKIDHEDKPREAKHCHHTKGITDGQINTPPTLARSVTDLFSGIFSVVRGVY